MRDKDFEYLYNLEERFWWFVAMRAITDTIVGSELKGRRLRILDAGCGTGYNIGHYESLGHSVFALDIAPEAISGVQQRGFPKVCQASVVEIPYTSGAFDFVFSFDVLSQVPVSRGLKLFGKCIESSGREDFSLREYQPLSGCDPLMMKIFIRCTDTPVTS